MPTGARPHAVVWTEERVKEYEEFGIRPRVAVWDLPDVGRFLQSVKDDVHFSLWWLVALRGPRRGEMAGLRWEDVDLVGGCFSIREQVTVVNGREVIGSPKSAAGVRTLALDDYSVQLLKALREWQRRRFGRIGPKDRVFRHADGRPARAEWLTRRFKELTEAAGLPPVRLHDLRHCAAGAAGAAGVDLMTIQRDLGHASPVTTAETYWVVFLEVARQSVQDTAALLLKHAKVRMSLEGASQA
jgi:integrase